MKKIKLCLFVLAFLFLMVCVIAHPSKAWIHGSANSNLNACGSVPVGQDWCVGTDGWTVLSATSGTGTCGNSSSNYTGTCIASVDSASGNDTTCTAQAAAANFTTASLPSFSPTLPCQTLSKAQSLLRNNSPDWMVLKKGGSWQGGMNGTASGSFAKSGLSANAPMLVAAYGTGSRPLIFHGAAAGVDQPCWQSQATNGNNIMILGIECHGDVFDPSSPNYQIFPILADTGVANCGSASVICNITSVPATVQATPTSFQAFGTGVSQIGITAATSTTITLASPPSFSATQMPLQITTTNSAVGFNFVGPTAFLYMEDVLCLYCGINPGYVALGATTQVIPKMFFNRNILAHSWSVSHGTNFFTPPTNWGGLTTFTQNVMSYGGWEPTAWGGAAFAQTHNMYLHDPASPFSIKGNISAFNASDNQWRECAASYNNLFLYNTGLNFSCEDWNGSSTYDVNSDTSDIIVGTRTANASATSGTALAIDGVLTNGAFNMVGFQITNISNPGSLATSSKISSITDAFHVTLNASIQSGIRGNGIQVGDQIVVSQARGGGISVQQFGVYVGNHPGTTGGAVNYFGPTTVSVTAASPSVVTETTAFRSVNEPFSFTSGTLPTGVSLGTATGAGCTGTLVANPDTGLTVCTYYVLATGTSYQFSATPGGSPINASGSDGSSVRTGSTLFSFAPPYNNQSNFLVASVPSWVTVGMKVYELQTANGFPNPNSDPQGGWTTVASIASDRSYLITTSANTANFSAGSGGSSDVTFLFGIPNNSNVPTARIGPNNVYSTYAGYAVGGNGAISFNLLTSGIDASQNYIYNYDPRGTTNDITDFGFAGTNIQTPQVLHVGPSSTLYPQANIEYYDAINRTGNTANVSIVGTVLTLNSGTAPSIGDTIFDASGANAVAQRTQVLSQITGSTYLVSVSQAVGPLASIFGSASHFVTMASSQSHDAGWNSNWTAGAANNFIRLNMGCTASSSPVCPPQPLN